MAKLLMNDKGDFVTIVLENKKDCDAFVSVLTSAIMQKPMKKVTNAAKLAKFLDDEMPV